MMSLIDAQIDELLPYGRKIGTWKSTESHHIWKNCRHLEEEHRVSARVL